jgi:hypothetical protein
MARSVPIFRAAGGRWPRRCSRPWRASAQYVVAQGPDYPDRLQTDTAGLETSPGSFELLTRIMADASLLVRASLVVHDAQAGQ